MFMPNLRRKMYSYFIPKIGKSLGNAHVAIYRATRGKVGGKYRAGSAFPRGVPVCLITTIGCKTGKPRTKAVLYHDAGDRIVLAASTAGQSHNPHWYNNLVANPEVTIQKGSTVHKMRARTADKAERTNLWPRMVGMFSDYETYQSWTDRVIPVVICEPVA
jgi:F420H(2)-dependent quinone reductase